MQSGPRPPLHLGLKSSAVSLDRPKGICHGSAMGLLYDLLVLGICCSSACSSSSCGIFLPSLRLIVVPPDLGKGGDRTLITLLHLPTQPESCEGVPVELRCGSSAASPCAAKQRLEAFRALFEKRKPLNIIQKKNIYIYMYIDISKTICCQAVHHSQISSCKSLNPTPTRILLYWSHVHVPSKQKQHLLRCLPWISAPPFSLP